MTENGIPAGEKEEKPDDELTDDEVLRKLFAEEAIRLLQAQTGDKPEPKSK